VLRVGVAHAGKETGGIGWPPSTPRGYPKEFPVSSSVQDHFGFLPFRFHLSFMLFPRKTESAWPPLSVPAPFRLSNTGQAPKKILVVDDDPVILKALSLILESWGYRVVTATDGSEAISQVRDEQPDMLLVDVCLPPDPLGCGASGWDGFQIARWIRNLSCKAPTIMISGSDKPEYRQAATACGARAFLIKPLDHNLLLAAIASTLYNKPKAGAVN
jgi:CheY-like chemotaxis protein